MEIAAVIIIVLLLVGFAFAAAHYFEKQRTEKWNLAAQELGLEFFAEGDAGLVNRMQKYQLFKLGRSRKLKNLVRGQTDDVALSIFDYQYTTGSGKNQHTSKQTVVLVESPLLVIPNFSMRPEGFFDKIGGMLGLQDIDFESHPTFSQMYVLKGDNEDEIRHFFTPDILEFFERKSKLSVESNLGGSLIFYHPGSRRKPLELKDLLSDAYEIYGIMADHSGASKKTMG